MRIHAVRDVVRGRTIAVAAVCALFAATVGSSPAQAGSITISYSLGPGIAVEPHTGAWVGVGGSATISVAAFRTSVSATMGFISGGTVLSLVLIGGPTHAPPYGMTYWTVAGPAPAPGVPPLVLPSIMGGFSGLTPAGGSLTMFVLGGAPPPTPNAPAVGQYNVPAGPMVFTGFFGLSAMGLLSGTGSAGVCFNAFGGVGPCTTALTASPFPSIPAAGSVPGFGAIGTEVGRVVAIEPVPEPGTAALLGLGVLGLAGAARRARRR